MQMLLSQGFAVQGYNIADWANVLTQGRADLSANADLKLRKAKTRPVWRTPWSQSPTSRRVMHRLQAINWPSNTFHPGL